jgi:hypothetical protein
VRREQPEARRLASAAARQGCPRVRSRNTSEKSAIATKNPYNQARCTIHVCRHDNWFSRGVSGVIILCKYPAAEGVLGAQAFAPDGATGFDQVGSV